MSLDLDPIKARFDAASLGPWEAQAYRVYAGLDILAACWLPWGPVTGDGSIQADAAFIAPARAVVPPLVAPLAPPAAGAAAHVLPYVRPRAWPIPGLATCSLQLLIPPPFVLSRIGVLLRARSVFGLRFFERQPRAILSRIVSLLRACSASS